MPIMSGRTNDVAWDVISSTVELSAVGLNVMALASGAYFVTAVIYKRNLFIKSTENAPFYYKNRPNQTSLCYSICVLYKLLKCQRYSVLRIIYDHQQEAERQNTGKVAIS
jgi:hypothetical protein